MMSHLSLDHRRADEIRQWYNLVGRATDEPARADARPTGKFKLYYYLKFLTLADWTGMVETELFAQTHKSYAPATVRYTSSRLASGASKIVLADLNQQQVNFRSADLLKLLEFDRRQWKYWPH